jgi:hypothetical protein
MAPLTSLKLANSCHATHCSDDLQENCTLCAVNEDSITARINRVVTIIGFLEETFLRDPTYQKAIRRGETIPIENKIDCILNRNAINVIAENAKMHILLNLRFP